MTEREKIKELRQYIALEMKTANIRERYEELYTAAVKITPSADNTGGGHSGSSNDKLERNCIKLLELEQKMTAGQRRLMRMDYAINELSYYHQKLVRMIDIDNVSIYRASKLLRRSYNAVKEAHEHAIQELNL